MTGWIAVSKRRRMMVLAVLTMPLLALPVPSTAHGGRSILESPDLVDQRETPNTPLARHMTDLSGWTNSQGLPEDRGPTGRHLYRTASGSDDQSQPYNIRFRCPGEGAQSGGIGQQFVDTVNCPAFVSDVEDVLGQPILLVDAKNPRLMAFNALHGGRGIYTPLGLQDSPVADREPPSPRSRDNAIHQPHTNFKSGNYGVVWEDNPFWAPEGLKGEGRRVFGEDNAAVLDAQGRLHFASLYSYHDTANSSWRYAVTLWKADRINQPIGYYDNLFTIRAAEDNRIDSLHMVYAKESDRVVVVWRESRNDTANSSEGLKSWIQAYSTQPGTGASWDALPLAARIGPCRGISNPLSHAGLLYIGCFPDQGYAQNASATIDLMQIHAIDTSTWTTRHVAQTSMGAGNVLLVDRGGTGYMILIASGVTSGRPFVKVSYGAMGTRWSDPEDYGRQLEESGWSSPEKHVVEARVTAAAYTTETGYVHLIYLEHYENSASNPQGEGKRMLFKTYAVIRPIVGYQGNFNVWGTETGLRAGSLIQPQLYQTGLTDGIFNDLHDSIVVFRNPRTGKERVFTAFGDYGMARFGEVVEEHALPAIPLPPLSIPPVPLATPGTTMAVESAIAGIIFGLMLLRLLTAKKKSVMSATSRG